LYDSAVVIFHDTSVVHFLLAGGGTRMKNRVAMALVCLHVSAAIYVIIGLLLFGLSNVPDFRDKLPTAFGVVALILCLVLVAGIEVVASGLRRRRFWAWVSGLCIFGLYLPSLFLPLGALGLWGLLSPGSRVAFGVTGSGTTA
jgi:chromate transport protein ChrA